MQDSFHYYLLANQAMVQRELLEELKSTELTLGQPKILDYLGEHDGSNQTQIAEACHIKGASLTVILNRMEEHQMVERRTREGNRRTYYVYLTPYGAELAQKIRQSFAGIEKKAFAGISPEEQDMFMRLFRTVYDNLKNI